MTERSRVELFGEAGGLGASDRRGVSGRPLALPLTDPRAAGRDAAPVRNAETLRASRLLIADGDDARLQGLSAIMEEEGFDVVACSTARLALEHFGRFEIDAAVVDLSLPDRAEMQLLQKLRAFSPDVPVIVNMRYGPYEPAREGADGESLVYVEECGDPAELVRQVHRGVQSRLKHQAAALAFAVAERTRDLRGATKALRQEIAERRRVEKALRKSKERYRLVSENIPVVVYSALPDGQSSTLFASGRVEELTGYTARQYMDEPALWERTVHAGDRQRVWREIRKCRTAGRPLDVEYRIVTKDGSIKWLRDWATPMFDRGGRLARIDGFMEDITERRQVRRQLLQSQKMEAIGHLAAGIAHDFRNQLAVIEGFAEMLLRHSLPDAEGRGHVEEIAKAVDRSAKLAGQLVAFGREEACQPQAVSLGGLIAELRKSLLRVVGEEIALLAAPGEAVCHAEVDPGQFEQAIVNLVVNARDAMPDGGTLRLRTDCVEADEAFAARHPEARPGPYAVVVVQDTGVGMDERTRARAFEPFFTTKAGGGYSGLGLSMVCGFVRRSGGLIEVDSAPGEGSTFRLYFPAVAGPAVEQRRQSAPQAVRRGSETVLFVEDEEALRRVWSESLREAGYTVLEAADAREALAAAEALDKPVDLLLSDVVMPGMSGPELARRLRERWPALPVLYVSGYGGQDLLRRGIDEADTYLLAKPFRLAELTAKVGEILDPDGR